jgi:hypothetical protein
VLVEPIASLERQDANLRRALRAARPNAAERIALEIDQLATVRDVSLTVAGQRVIAWTEAGPEDGQPILRLPGTPALSTRTRDPRGVARPVGRPQLYGRYDQRPA